MSKTFDELLKENRELLDLVVGKLMNANMKLALIQAIFKVPSPLAQNAYLRAEVETLREACELVNEVLEKVVDYNSYTDKDMYTLMRKYKEVSR